MKVNFKFILGINDGQIANFFNKIVVPNNQKNARIKNFQNLLSTRSSVQYKYSVVQKYSSGSGLIL